jgi:hypothetical protein
MHTQFQSEYLKRSVHLGHIGAYGKAYMCVCVFVYVRGHACAWFILQ